VYQDDILVIGSTFPEHINNLVKVFSRLRQLSKCCQARTEVEYLGHVVSQGGVTADPKKVEAVQAYPVPTNLKSLRPFLGLLPEVHPQNFMCSQTPPHTHSEECAVRPDNGMPESFEEALTRQGRRKLIMIGQARVLV